MLCPICKKPVEEPRPGQPPPRCFPFCSDRCKLIDLGRWLGGKYQLPVEISPDEDDKPAAPPPPPRP
ncbi:MAG TPA: DNA gyrase inhibitor YacG [Tepidisphaeraceae bacterium]|nr:DNA gyrase inhibitor YacG [Tepidisphaeraceae bacterium]